MVLQMPRPFKHPKTGVYYFRVRIPADLVDQMGKREFKVSLGTKDPTTAKRLFSDKEREFDARCRALRATPASIPHRQIVALAGKLYHQMMTALEDEPGEPEIWKRVLEIGEAVYANEDKMERWYGPSVDQLMLSEGIALDASSRSRLLHEVHSALKQAAEQQLKRSQGDYSPDPKADRFPKLGPAKSDGPTLPDLFKLWERDHKAEGKSLRTVEDFRQKIDDFVTFLGHNSATRVTPRDVANYTEHLRHERGLSARTVGTKYLAAIRTVYRTAISKIVVTEDPTAPVRVRVSKEALERPKGFTDVEAETILQCAMRDPSTLGRMSDLNKLAIRWVPWICAYTGSRVGEITQLRREDFVEEFGIKCVRITPEAGTVKSKTYRLVPIHPHLIEMGLMEFVQSRPAGPIFYRPSGKKTRAGYHPWNSVTGKISDWVRDTAGVTDPRVQPNHGWRHRFKTIARDVDIAHRYMDALQGHKDGSASTDYGENTVKALYREILKMPRYKY